MRGRAPWALLALVALLALACGRSTLTPSEFRSEVEKSIVAAHPTMTLEVQGELQVGITGDAGRKAIVYLDNAYQEYLQAPESVQEIVSRFAASLLESSDLSAVDRSRIVPVLKDRAWIGESIAAVKGHIGGGGDGLAQYVSEPYNDQLTIVYAEDRPKSVRYLRPEDLVTLGVTAAELRPLALENLRRLLPQIELHRLPTVTMITAGGSYEASLLLLDEVWNGEIVPVSGDPVVALPTRDLLLVTGTKTPGGIARLRELAVKAQADSAYRLTDTLFVYRDGRFSAFVAP